MKEYLVEKTYAGSRLDKYVQRILPGAPWSLIQRLIRKRTLSVNGKKAHAEDLIRENDCIRVFLPDEKIEELSAGTGSRREKNPSVPTALSYHEAYHQLRGRIGIVYEDESVLVGNKPAGVLSQKADPKDLTLNEWFVGYLLEEKDLPESSLSMYTPSVVNRLDRNTQGLVLCAKTYEAGRALSQALRDRTLRKYYAAVVEGRVDRSGVIDGYLIRDEKTGISRVVKEKAPGGSYSKTLYEPVKVSPDGSCTLLSLELVTGKTHQLRAHLSFVGHPILGDPKYGNRKRNEALHLRYQLLCCVKVVFPPLQEEALSGIGGRTIAIDVPKRYRELVRG